MMSQWVLAFCFLISLQTLASEVRSENHDTNSSTQDEPRRSSNKKTDLETAKQKVLNQAVDELWWENAHFILEKMGKDHVQEYIDTLPDGAKKDLITALVSARFDTDPAKLRTEATEAAKQEFNRRTTKDPNVGLISRLFGIRPESAMVREDKIQKALDGEDEKLAAELIAELVNSKNRKERPTLLANLKKELSKEEVKQDPRRLRLVQRFIWSLEENLDKDRGSSTLENSYKDLTINADEKAQKQNHEFFDNVEKAARGDKEALNKILTKYSTESLIDFMAANGNVALAQALGWKDKDGKINLDLKASDPGFHPEGSPQTQTWVLGKTPEEIKKSLENFSKSHGPDFESSTPGGNHFSRFDLNQDPDKGSHRHFFAAIDHGTEPVIPTSEKNRLCQVEAVPPEKKIPLNQTAWYFFRQFPDSDFVGYAAANGKDSQNFLVDLNDPKHEIRLPGPYDPVPTTDNRYITVPSATDANTDGIKFYTQEEARTKGANAKPFFQDDSLAGVYQSIGTVTEDATSSTYRIITDLGNLSFRDYKVTHANAATHQPPKVEALRKGPVKLCENTGITLVTPMLSKDGKQVSFLDVEAGVTKIFDITNPDTGECKLSLDLGIYTGKVDFNYNGDEITFHKYENERPRERYITVPSDALVGNVYVYKRSTKQLVRLSNNTDSNAVYPSFRKNDGMVVYLDHAHHEGDKDEKSSLVVVDPRKGRLVPSDFIKATEDPKSQKGRQWQALTALGSLWSQICSESGAVVSSEGAVMATLNLYPERCEELVDGYWLSFRNGIIENRELAKSTRTLPGSLALLSRNEVKNACPKVGGRAPVVDGETDSEPSGSSGGGQQAKSPVPQSCLGCHSNPENDIPFNDLDRLKGMKARFTTNPDGSPMSMIEAIFDRISTSDTSRRMPKNGQALSTAEKVALRKYLQQ